MKTHTEFFLPTDTDLTEASTKFINFVHEMENSWSVRQIVPLAVGVFVVFEKES